jgi:periplasmic nitrate reductase NapE
LIHIKVANDSLLIVSSGNGPEAVQIPKSGKRGNHMSVAGDDDTQGRLHRRRMEIFAFLFLTAVLMPVLAVATVGGYGLAVWIYQMAAGPPGPPAR